MTEDEAKQKACCNGGRPPMENGPCIASACMAWRWETKELRKATQYMDNTTEGYFQGPTGIRAEGHCGLAGGHP